MVRRRIFKLVIALTILFVQLSQAQNIIGKITEENGVGIPGLNLILSGTNITASTNGLGAFRFYDVPKGEYTIVIQDAGYKLMSSNVKVASDGVVDLGSIIAQVETSVSSNEIEVINIEDLQQITDDDAQAVSSVLTSGRDPFDEAAAYNLGSGRFRARGYNNEDTEVYFNGMNANDLDDGRVFFNSWGGLNDVTRAQSNILSMQNNEYAFGGLRGMTFIDMRASVQRVQTRLSYSFSNRSYRHRMMITKSSGMQKNGWAYSFSVSKRYANQGYIKGTHFDGFGYYVGIDRKINDKNLLSLVVLGAPLRRGKTAAVVQEAYDLSGSNFYNANWGYQQGKVRNSREDRIHEPIITLRHDLNISKNTKLLTVVGYQFGKNGNTRLDWYLAGDPRPDYYRKLPSFQTSEELKTAVSDYLLGDPSKMQLPWDWMYEANRNRIVTVQDADGISGNNITGRSAAYVLLEQRFDVNKLSVNSVLNSTVGKMQYTFGINGLRETNHNYQLVDDLMGADFYPDFDDFALRDFPGNANALQNDLNKPNRVVKKGGVVGYDYNLTTSDYGAWGQAGYIGKSNDAFISIKSSYVSFYRDGMMKNGRFPDNSYGKSGVNNFLTYGIKIGDTYKINGRNYIYANAQYKTRAPYSRFAYLSARIRDQIVDGLTTEKIYGGEIGYIFKWAKMRGRVTAYATQFDDQIENTSFYHDELRTFVNYVTYDISKMHRGIEAGINASITTRVSLEAALSLGNYQYTNRPKASITQDNSSKVITEGKTIYIKNFFVPGTPQTAGTFGINYDSPKFWGLSLNVNYFDHNYVDINPERRTEEATDLISKIEDPAKYNAIRNQEKLPSAYTVDLFLRKSYRLKNRNIIAANLSVGNLLDKKDFITSGFEQGRFDYTTKDVSKFPNKYWYGFGRNFSLNISYNF